jgi:hypothetical protein
VPLTRSINTHWLPLYLPIIRTVNLIDFRLPSALRTVSTLRGMICVRAFNMYRSRYVARARLCTPYLILRNVRGATVTLQTDCRYHMTEDYVGNSAPFKLVNHTVEILYLKGNINIFTELGARFRSMITASVAYVCT